MLAGCFSSCSPNDISDGISHIVARPLPDRDIAMPQRFESYVFSPRANKLMREAFEAAWPKAALLERDRELTRRMLASAIIDQVIGGAEDPGGIAAAALATLAVAKNISS
jgi:hypothetical protein